MTDGLNENVGKVHTRRVRYGGTHPKKFNQKYKELNPQKYTDDVAKIIEHGRTPAGMHISICVSEILDFLQIQKGQIGLDATLGYGGHTKKMLEKLENEGHLYALDVDRTEMEKTKKRLADLGYGENILTIKQINFANIDNVLPNEQKFDFVLADLGLSSMQIDNPERGFSFKHDGPLDLRLNTEYGITAAKRLQNITLEELEKILNDNADEPYAKKIATAIIRQEKISPITTTKALARVVSNALTFLGEDDRKKSCQRIFQAIRIDINREYIVLNQFMQKLPFVLAKGGRVAILTFHSGEDRIVKKAFKQHFAEGLYSDVAKDVIRPSSEECYANPRAHSAKLRWAIKS